MNALHTEEYKGHVIRIYSDDYPPNPREGDDMTTFVMFHGKYDLGDTKDHTWKHEDYSGWAAMQVALEKNYRLVVPVYMYDHSGVSLSTSPFSCPWDSGQVGFVVASADAIRGVYGVKRLTRNVMEKARRYVEGAVESYSKYVNGEYVSATIQAPGEEEGEHLGGFEDCELAVQQAKDEIDYKVLL
jgi:hypothetical protein